MKKILLCLLIIVGFCLCASKVYANEENETELVYCTLGDPKEVYKLSPNLDTCSIIPSSIASFTDLVFGDFRGFIFEDETALKSLTNLIYLDISNTNVSDASNIPTENLMVLDFKGSQIKNFDSLREWATNNEITLPSNIEIVEENEEEQNEPILTTYINGISYDTTTYLALSATSSDLSYNIHFSIENGNVEKIEYTIDENEAIARFIQYNELSYPTDFPFPIEPNKIYQFNIYCDTKNDPFVLMVHILLDENTNLNEPIINNGENSTNEPNETPSLPSIEKPIPPQEIVTPPSIESTPTPPQIEEETKPSQSEIIPPMSIPPTIVYPTPSISIIEEVIDVPLIEEEQIPESTIIDETPSIPEEITEPIIKNTADQMSIIERIIEYLIKAIKAWT